MFESITISPSNPFHCGWVEAMLGLPRRNFDATPCIGSGSVDLVQQSMYDDGYNTALETFMPKAFPTREMGCTAKSVVDVFSRMREIGQLKISST